ASVPSPTLSTIQQSVVPEPEASVAAPVQEPIREREPVRESTPKKGLPLSLFGAIAIGCAAGSFLIMQSIRQSTQARQPLKRLKPTATARKKRRHPSNGNPPVPKSPQPAPSKPTLQTLNTQLATSNNSLNPVTVLPPEENHPLDGGEESLADMMDLRKRHSLASLMRNR
ncbi:MAG: hypothetical protein LDL41_25200, partial [Coleofasciculus sp. S288]|nr:hypothetical protein [Coleofasciculus sp. S288]